MKKHRYFSSIFILMVLLLVLSSCTEDLPKVATPDFNIPGGDYTSLQRISISCATAGATIHYTTDGSDPTFSSRVYSGYIDLYSNTTLKAKAFKSGWASSDIASATYSIVILENVANPTFNPPGGDYVTAQSVFMNCATAGATIRYTTDGEEPIASSTVYNGPISINGFTRLQARAFKAGWNESGITQAIYIISDTQTVAMPVFYPPGGTYNAAQSINIVCATEGSTIRYTTDGSNPTLASAVYNGALDIRRNTTIKAKAFRSGWTDSAMATASYTINEPNTVANPTFSPLGGTHYVAQSVTIACATSGATIRYTTDGTDPNQYSTAYTRPVSILHDTTLKARAYKYLYTSSDIVSAEYTIVPADFVHILGGTFTMGDTRQVGENSERPTHSVTLSSYYMDRYEVTQAEYYAVMGYNSGVEYGYGSNYPAYSVSWYSALKFCNLRSIAEELTPVYTISGSTDPNTWGGIPATNNAIWNDVSCDWEANGYRLPTEAEWEYAARGGSSEPDYLYSGTDAIDTVAWYTDNATGSKPVGGKAPNALGIYDMSGNVYEWCWDVYGAYSSSPATNPHGPASQTNRTDRVRRGGYWESNATFCRNSFRGFNDPASALKGIGFRLCRTEL